MNGLHLSLLAQADSGNSVLWTFLIYMVGVFVSDEDAVEPVGNAVDGGEALFNLPGAEAAVYQQPGAVGLQVGGVAR